MTGLELLRAAQRFHGQPYSMANPGRTDPASGIKDCSGLIVAAFRTLGVNPGGTVSTTLETWAVRNGGRYVDRTYALTHPGVGLSIWGIGAAGHIGLSLGDGVHAYETPSGEGRRVGYSLFGRNRWQRFFTWPGVNHDVAGGSAPGGKKPSPVPGQANKGAPKQRPPKNTEAGALALPAIPAPLVAWLQWWSPEARAGRRLMRAMRSYPLADGEPCDLGVAFEDGVIAARAHRAGRRLRGR